MSQTSAAFNRDANQVPITNNGLLATKSITYAAGSTGATGATTLFTVTGVVSVTVFGVCGTSLTSGGSATMEVGIAGNTATLIAQTTATNITAPKIWASAAPATAFAPNASKILSATDITQTIGTTTVTAGVLTYYCLWTPISADGNVVAA